jgi:hypothetical protein
MAYGVLSTLTYMLCMCRGSTGLPLRTQGQFTSCRVIQYDSNYRHQTEIALAEANAQYKRYEIDLRNKPEWYSPKVNPASKVGPY